jgi:RNA polymerase sigma-70 factor (ECF subfamily)
VRNVLPLLVETRFARINGSPGIVAAFSDGSLQTTALQMAGGLITAIYIVVNPDKLGHVARMTR